MRQRAMNLPRVVDCRAQCNGELAEVCPGEFEFENAYAWRIEYKAVYRDGPEDSRLKARAMGGANERVAIVRLQKLLGGFGVVEIRIYHVRPPATVRQIEMIRQADEWLQETE